MQNALADDLGVFREAGGEIEEDLVDLEEDLGVLRGKKCTIVGIKFGINGIDAGPIVAMFAGNFHRDVWLSDVH